MKDCSRRHLWRLYAYAYSYSYWTPNSRRRELRILISHGQVGAAKLNPGYAMPHCAMRTMHRNTTSVATELKTQIQAHALCTVTACHSVANNVDKNLAEPGTQN